MPLTQLIHITAAYSNAVLVAILPHVNAFAKKLDLPIPLPITISQVDHFNVNPMQGFIGGGLWLTNHYQFVFNNGSVISFKLLNGNPFLTEDPAKDWPRYVGKENMNTNEAVEFARSKLLKLGYDVKTLHADTPASEIQGPYDLREGHFPYCQIDWRDGEMRNAINLRFQIDMADRSLVGMSIFNTNIWQSSPPIDVVPETQMEYRKRIQGKMYFNTNASKSLGMKPVGDEPNSVLVTEPKN